MAFARKLSSECAAVLRRHAAVPLTWSRCHASRRVSPVAVSHVRTIHASSTRWHCDENVSKDAPAVDVVFVDKDGVEKRVVGRVGQNIVHVAHANGIDLEGACECSLACSTCHVILEPRVYAQLPPPVDEEEDLLDLAFGLTASSRLGCQVRLPANMREIRIKLPAATRNFYVDGHKPKPH